MKKLWLAVLSLGMAGVLTACGGSAGPSGNNSPPPESSKAAVAEQGILAQGYRQLGQNIQQRAISLQTDLTLQMDIDGEQVEMSLNSEDQIQLFGERKYASASTMKVLGQTIEMKSYMDEEHYYTQVGGQTIKVPQGQAAHAWDTLLINPVAGATILSEEEKVLDDGRKEVHLSLKGGKLEDQMNQLFTSLYGDGIRMTLEELTMTGWLSKDGSAEKVEASIRYTMDLAGQTVGVTGNWTTDYLPMAEGTDIRPPAGLNIADAVDGDGLELPGNPVAA